MEHMGSLEPLPGVLQFIICLNFVLKSSNFNSCWTSTLNLDRRPALLTITNLSKGIGKRFEDMIYLKMYFLTSFNFTETT